MLVAVDAAEPALRTATADALRRQSLSLRYRAASGEPLDQLLVQGFALVREASRRQLGKFPYPVQLLGGFVMHQGSVAEMQTGEGKTLTAILPLYVAALTGRGAHLATANDYLAARDAELVRPVFESLGVSIGVIQSRSTNRERQHSYKQDITYGTAKEFAFDFLRDRLNEPQVSDRKGLASCSDGSTLPASGLVQRGLYFLLADEADSLLIDEARTPLIISAVSGRGAEAVTALFRWTAELAPQLVESIDFEYDSPSRTVALTAGGRRRVRQCSLPGELATVDMLDIYQHVDRAIKILRDFQRDRHYVVRDGAVVIIDEFTGRPAEGRKWRDGIHQAIEAKEQLDISVRSEEAARITVQDFCQRYERLAGMTGTAYLSRRELGTIYRLKTVVIPTHRPCQRTAYPTIVCRNGTDKWGAIVSEVVAMLGLGRPVLIGTRSIDRSETLSSCLKQAGLEHHVLNARHQAREAEIIRQAGQSGRITVATNMAGRGTDILLGPDVSDRGGLHVICSELHEAARIDRQLIGRCARQGDPGSYRQFLALDDEILRSGLGIRQAADLLRWAHTASPEQLNRTISYFQRAQDRVEREHFRQRRMLLYHERERRQVQEQMGQDPHLESPG